jgi:hypothetical protein
MSQAVPRRTEIHADACRSARTELPIASELPLTIAEPTKPTSCRNRALDWCRGTGDDSRCCGEQVVTAVGADRAPGHRLHARARGSECTSAVRARLGHTRSVRGAIAGRHRYDTAVRSCRYYRSASIKGRRWFRMHLDRNMRSPGSPRSVPICVRDVAKRTKRFSDTSCFGAVFCLYRSALVGGCMYSSPCASGIGRAQCNSRSDTVDSPRW